MTAPDRPGDRDQQQAAEDPYAEYRQWVSNDRPGCACGGPCEHDGSLGLERAFHDGYDRGTREGEAAARAEEAARWRAKIEALSKWASEAVIALDSATVISQRMHHTGQVEGLHLGNHDRLVREAAALGVPLYLGPGRARALLDGEQR